MTFNLERLRQVSYERPDPPLSLTGDFDHPAIAIPAQEKQALLDRVSWKEAPPIYEDGGRSAFLPRREILQANGSVIGGYKLKGVGHLDDGEICLPNTSPFAREKGTVLQHVGINDEGGLYPVPDSRKPLGGMPYGKGRQEFDMAQRLFQAGIPVTAPIMHGNYPDLQWEGNPMSWVVLSLPTADHERFSNYFDQDARHHIYAAMEQNGVGSPLEIISDAYYKMGQILRRCHEAGVVRFAGHTGNWSYIPERAEMCMHDFDSSVLLESLSEKAKAVAMIRDIKSAVIGGIHSLIRSDLLNTRDLLNAFLDGQNPVVDFVKGYSQVGIGPRPLSTKFMRNIRKELGECLLDVSRSKDMMEWLQVFHGVRNPMIFSYIFEWYQHSSLNKDQPLPYGHGQFLSELTSFMEQAHAAAVA